MTAVPCSSSPCGNKTTDPSGKCHVHRNGSSSGQVPTFHESLSATPSPSASEYADDAGRSREMVRVHHSAKESAQGIKGASVSRTTTNNGMDETITVRQPTGYRNSSGQKMEVSTSFVRRSYPDGLTSHSKVIDPDGDRVVYDSKIQTINGSDSATVKGMIENPRVGMYSPADNRGIRGLSRRIFGGSVKDDQLNENEGSFR